MPKMGRPTKNIDQKEFEKLCSFFCTKREIASFFEVSEDTIERWCKKTYKQTFAVTYDQKSDGGRISIRRAQFQKALSGNIALLIWLGKQYLGQAEKIEEKSAQEIKTEVTYIAEWGTQLPNDSTDKTPTT